jgi:hypothetical protein
VARIDFEVSGGGTVYLFKPPLTAAARDWVDEHLPEDAMDWCGAVVVEHRYISEYRPRRDQRRTRGPMSRHVKRPRPEPASEEFLALILILSPFAYIRRSNWRRLGELAGGWAYLAAA